MDFEVRRDNIRQHRVTDGGPVGLADGDVLVHIDECALTANNITYAAFGQVMRYWNFFPAEAGWGRIPVWGFADVVESRCADIVVGERVYGYFPMSTHLTITPGKVNERTFVDVAEHRRPLPPVYNQYRRITERADAHSERLESVLRPLFTTSFLIDDWLADNDMFGASSVVIGSASSKTALALAASLMARRETQPGVEIIGLTSARNAEFVRNVGYYDRVVVYGEVAGLDAGVATVFVDMGGDAAVLDEVHGHFTDRLVHSCQVGATHWEQVGAVADLAGPRPQMFFAPDQIQRRVADWGSAGFDERVSAAYGAFAASAESWLEITVHRGPDAVAAVFADVVDGRLAPSEAAIISLDRAAS